MGKHTGKILIIISAFFTATGQLFWKMGHTNYTFMLIGFICYGTGALLMIKSFAMEKLSVAYPLMATSYIFAMFYGGMVLDEPITMKKLLAIFLLFIGVSLTSYEK